MRKFIAIIAVVAVCGCLLTGCNEKPKSYRFVKVMNDGTEQVEDITAKNDTDALRQYMKAMEKVILENIDKPDAQPFKAMFVISPEGDTLNTNNKLLEAAMEGQTGVTTIQQPAAPAPGPKMTPLKKMPPGAQPLPAAPAK